MALLRHKSRRTYLLVGQRISEEQDWRETKQDGPVLCSLESATVEVLLSA